VTKPVEEVDDDDSMPEWKRLSVERSLQGPRARAQERTDRFVGAAMELMAERGTHYVPTLVVTRCGEFFDELGVPRWMQQRSLAAGPRHEQSYQLSLAAGVEVMLGSDMPPFWPFEGTTATVRELEHMAGSGLPPMRALRAATVVPARWLGAADDSPPAIQDAARQGMARWRTFMVGAPPAQATCARVILRSYQLMWKAAQ